jgi:hypothetical protein
MERERDPGEQSEERSGFDTLADATGMDRPNELPAMGSGDDAPPDEHAGGGEKTAVEGAAGLGAMNRQYGGGPTNVPGGIGTHVPADEDEHVRDDPSDSAAGDRTTDSTDPRGY